MANINSTLYVDYIEIDKQEKTLFHTNELEYFYDIIDPPIIVKINSTNTTVPLHFTKPVKELIVVLTGDDPYDDLYDFFEIKNIKIKLNNIEIETPNDNVYFKTIQPYYHERKPTDKNIYMYSFALDPDNSQPTGAFNFGNLKNKELIIETTQSVLFKENSSEKKNISAYIYANVNNVLLVRDGQAKNKFI